MILTIGRLCASINGAIFLEKNTLEFIHPRLDTAVEAIGGHYVVTREERAPHSWGEILYFIGHAVADRSCCGIGGCGYAMVAGYIVSFKYRMTEDGRYISGIEPVNEKSYPEILRMIRIKEGVTQVHFLRADGDYKW
jgi:hypothetical protein